MRFIATFHSFLYVATFYVQMHIETSFCLEIIFMRFNKIISAHMRSAGLGIVLFSSFLNKTRQIASATISRNHS